jgi:beta-galactosidase/beta-glucuronidase
VSNLKATTDGFKVNITVYSASQQVQDVQITVTNENSETIASGSGQSDSPFTISVENPALWGPGNPALYNVTVTLGEDNVLAYTGFRSVEKGTVEGVVRPLLNGEFVYAFGPLE